ncbi:RelA/SpoT domain-containing protein [Nitrosococcus wardiae]|uniref:(P)ppGpp synthetase n=1 Tax=Nitrosococcus wardiae TaxID=1814290 RepID=A0A4P7BXW8_9GAMM|nr:RelA/SpoT domain-containing protein [Nitrosococcus wardiae]QBQ54049.1 (p)ppGpp synthetase [Nitrosococcus wardiae]
MKEKYSGKEIIKAGEMFLSDNIFDDIDKFNKAMDVLSYWRFQHEYPLEKALSILKEEAGNRDKAAIFAKRLKRYVSIVAKLRRFPKMKLKNMQDIGGCRAIVSNTKKLYQIVRELRRRPEFRNQLGKIRYKDYIKKPKDDGYRGYHLIGSFEDQRGDHKLIEIQLRTTIQHDWATALEIVDLFTGQALKSSQGEQDWKDFFKLVSEHFALMDEIHLFNTKKYEEQLNAYKSKIEKKTKFAETRFEIQAYESSLDVVKNLEAFAHSLKAADEHISQRKVEGYVLLKVDTRKAEVSSTLFDDTENEEAEKMYLEYEKETAENKDIVVALVSTTAVGGIKEAYPNYFADSTDFLKYLMLIIKSSIRPNLFRRILNESGL